MFLSLWEKRADGIEPRHRIINSSLVAYVDPDEQGGSVIYFVAGAILHVDADPDELKELLDEADRKDDDRRAR